MDRSFVRSFSVSSAVASTAVLMAASAAHATTNCQFVQSTKAMTLQASCSTDATIVVPNGMALEGQGFKITAIDPPGGNFQGPILRNAGKSMTVRNLFLRTNLADFCNDDANKVIGILADKSAATIQSVNVTIAKAAGASTCSEGVAVQVQNLPYSPKTTYLKSTIKTSTFKDNQLTAVLGLGNVSLRVESNLIKNTQGEPVAQRGIELQDGVKGTVLTNQVLRSSHSPLDNDPAYGILLDNVAQTTVQGNEVRYNDINIRVIGGTKVTVKANTVSNATLDGILLDDAEGVPAKGNTFWANDSQKNGLNGIHLQSINGNVTGNVVKYNTVSRNTGSGIATEGTGNKVQSNIVSLNTGLDIADFGAGTGNLYQKNTCGTSTGLPVDCPH